MSLSFESILDKTTTLGGVSTPKKRRDDPSQHDRGLLKQRPNDEPTDAVVGPEEETRWSRQAMRKANAGITLLQIAEGSLEEIAAVLLDMRNLIEQATETLRDGERFFFQTKLERLALHIDELATRAAFEELHFLNGTVETINIRIQVQDDIESLTLRLPDLRAKTLGLNNETINVQSSHSSQRALSLIDRVLEPIQEYRVHFSDIQSQLEQTLHRLEALVDDTVASHPRIRGAELALRTATVMRECITNDQTRAIAGQSEALHQDAKHLVS